MCCSLHSQIFAADNSEGRKASSKPLHAPPDSRSQKLNSDKWSMHGRLRCRVNQKKRRLSPWHPRDFPLSYDFPQEFLAQPLLRSDVFPVGLESFYTPQITRGISVCMALICSIMMILCIINKFHPSTKTLPPHGTCLACLHACLDIYIHCTMIFWPEKHALGTRWSFILLLAVRMQDEEELQPNEGCEKDKKQ